MPRTFACLRISTPGQTTDNQLREIQAAGFNCVKADGKIASNWAIQRQGNLAISYGLRHPATKLLAIGQHKDAQS